MGKLAVGPEDGAKNAVNHRVSQEMLLEEIGTGSVVEVTSHYHQRHRIAFKYFIEEFPNLECLPTNSAAHHQCFSEKRPPPPSASVEPGLPVRHEFRFEMIIQQQELLTMGYETDYLRFTRKLDLIYLKIRVDVCPERLIEIDRTKRFRTDIKGGHLPVQPRGHY